MATADSVNTVSVADWKKAKTAVIEKTAWWKGSGTGVGGKLEAWQKARIKAKAVRKAILDNDYEYNPKHEKILKDALKALIILHAALVRFRSRLAPIYNDAIKKAEIGGADNLEEYNGVYRLWTMVDRLKVNAEKKIPKWKRSVQRFTQLKDIEEEQRKQKTMEWLREWGKTLMP